MMMRDSDGSLSYFISRCYVCDKHLFLITNVINSDLINRVWSPR